MNEKIMTISPGLLNLSGQELQKSFEAKITSHLYKYYYCSLGLADWQARVDARKNEVPRSIAMLKTVEQITGLALKNKKMLDIGCGWGGHVVAALRMGLDAFGCDVDEDVLEIAAMRCLIQGFDANRYFLAPAERLPFADNEFDYVQAVSVLEHVDDVPQAISEFVRVLKPGGIGFIQAPNYSQPFEPHYKLLFPPKCPKGIGKLYLRLLGRPADFLDTVNYIDCRTVKRAFESCGAIVDDVYRTYSKIWPAIYKREVIDTETTPPAREYPQNSFCSRVMCHLGTIAKSFTEKFLGITPVLLIVRKKQ